MAFQGNWIENNYYRPLTEIHNIEQQNKFLQLPQSNFSFSDESIDTTPKLSQRKSPSEKKKDNSCCSIWWNSIVNLILNNFSLKSILWIIWIGIL